MTTAESKVEVREFLDGFANKVDVEKLAVGDSGTTPCGSYDFLIRHEDIDTDRQKALLDYSMFRNDLYSTFDNVWIAYN